MRHQPDRVVVIFTLILFGVVAEELGEVKGVCRTNLNLALLKGGKPEEALPVLQEAARTGPQGPALACLVSLHTANALAALGRWHEARARLLVSEKAAQVLPRTHRDLISRDLEQCRLKLEEAPQAQPKPEGLEEL